MSILIVSDYSSIRSATNIDLVTEASLPDNVISQSRYLGMALQDVLDDVPKLKELVDDGSITWPTLGARPYFDFHISADTYMRFTLSRGLSSSVGSEFGWRVRFDLPQGEGHSYSFSFYDSRTLWLNIPSGSMVSDVVGRPGIATRELVGVSGPEPIRRGASEIAEGQSFFPFETDAGVVPNAYFMYLYNGSRLDQVATAAEYDGGQKLKLQVAAITRTAWRLFPYIRQVVRVQAGEESEDYAKIDWDALRQLLLDEYLMCIDELNGGDGGLTVAYKFQLIKAG